MDSIGDFNEVDSWPGSAFYRFRFFLLLLFSSGFSFLALFLSIPAAALRREDDSAIRLSRFARLLSDKLPFQSFFLVDVQYTG